MQTTRGASLSDADHDIAPPPVGASPKRLGLLAAMAVLVYVADLVSKIEIVRHLRPGQSVHVVGDLLRLTLTRNPGAAFSIGTGQTVLFALVAVAVIIAIIRTARRLRSSGWAVVLGLLLGGALGNLTDRIFRAPGPLRGYVVDWIQLPHWPVFNIADSAIVIGGVVAVLLALVGVEVDGRRSGGHRAGGAASPDGGDEGSAYSERD